MGPICGRGNPEPGIRVAAINDIGSNDGVAGGLGCLGDAAKPGAGVQHGLAAIKIFDLKQPDRDPGRLHIMI